MAERRKTAHFSVPLPSPAMLQCFFLIECQTHQISINIFLEYEGEADDR